MAQVYVRVEIYNEIVRRGYDPKEFVNNAVAKELEREKSGK